MSPYRLGYGPYITFVQGPQSITQSDGPTSGTEIITFGDGSQKQAVGKVNGGKIRQQDVRGYRPWRR